jgi:excisionase family DNA binding protein
VVKPSIEFFSFDHLPPHLQEISRKFHELAHFIERRLPGHPETGVELRKLLESKDAAVRAAHVNHKIGALAAKAHVTSAPAKSSPQKSALPRKALFTMKEFCIAHNISRSTAYKEVNEGRLKLTRLGRKVLVAAQDARDWVEAIREGALDTGPGEALK